MSWKLVKLCYAARLPKLGGPRGSSSATEKAVLVRMAEFGDDAGGNIRPAVKTIAEDCELSVRAVVYAIGQLIERGIVRETRQSSGLHKRATEYAIDLDALGCLAGPAAEEVASCEDAAGGPAEPIDASYDTPLVQVTTDEEAAGPAPCVQVTTVMDANYDTIDASYDSEHVVTCIPTTIEPSKEPPEEPTLNARPAARASKRRSQGELTGDLLRDFEEWYAAYPIHKARGDAEKAYAKACKTASAGTLLEAARRYGDEQKAKGKLEFAKHPATWLNKKCWLDEPDPQQEQPDYDPFGVRQQSGGVDGSASDLFQFGQQTQRAQKPSVIDIGREAYMAHEGREP